MNTFLIIHLSDLHIQSADSEKWNRGRAAQIARSAVRSGPHSFVIVVASGDIAYGGRPQEYEIAEAFLTDIVAEAKQLVNCPVKVVVAAGNHDCDFSDKSKLRAMARTLPSEESVNDPEMLAKLAEPLENYRQFESRIEDFHFQERTLLHKSGVLDIGNGALIQFRVLASSLYSDIHEKKGELFLPSSLFESGWRDDCFRVAVMHHPPAWFTEASGRPIRSALRAHAHVILYGHEHVPELAQVTTPLHGSATEVIEIDGAVLQAHGDSGKSSFITLELDPSTDAIEALEHNWQIASNCFSVSSLAASKRGPGWIRVPRKASTLGLRETFQERLRDPGVVATSRSDKQLVAKDLYVYPELAEAVKFGATQEEMLPATRLLQPEELHAGLVVQGDEKSGKTALLFRLFESFHDAGYVPLYVSLRDHKIKDEADFRKAIARSVGEIYNCLTPDTLAAISKERRVYLFDDIDALTKPTLREHLVNLLRAQAGCWVATTTMRPQLTEVITDDSSGVVGRIRQVKIAKMTAVMRGQIITQWVRQVEQVVDDEALIARVDYLEKTASVTLGNNLVPRVPHMLLIFLQSNSAAAQAKLESGALAHYYQYLVTQYLLSAGVKNEELDEPISFARIVAYAMHLSGKSYVTRDELEKCNTEFCEEFIPGSLQFRLNMLVNARLLTELGSDSFQWRAPYIHYLFLGGYLSRNLENGHVRAVINDMVRHLYVRNNANALLFLVHFSKDVSVFRDLTNVINDLFKDDKPLRLGEDTKEFAEIIRNPNALHGPEDPLEARKRRNEIRDTEGGNDDGLTDGKNGGGVLTFLEEIIVLFKTSEIVGQVLKEQYASIGRTTREPIVVALLDAYLRASGGIIRKMALNKSLMQRWIEARLADRSDSLNESERIIAAQGIVAQLVQMFMFGFFQKLAESIASDKTLDLVKHIKWPDYIEPKVLLLACELNIQRPIPFGQIDALLKSAEGDPAFVALIRNLVQMRISLFHTRAPDLQALASRFKIEVRKLNAMDFNESIRR